MSSFTDVAKELYISAKEPHISANYQIICGYTGLI